MIVEIDPYAGFCFGVEKAIEMAESMLIQDDALLCLGQIVHNEEENKRLSGMGLRIIDKKEFNSLKNETVLIRAHGEPPETYRTAQENNLRLIEATCPVVLKLQQRVHRAWLEMKNLNGTVVIAGKKNHPEVVGLAGQAEDRAVVAETPADLDAIDFSRPVRLFAQTTISREKYDQIKDEISARMTLRNPETANFRSFNSICGQVANRIPDLQSFCKLHDVIIFVSGKNSSNGKNLYEACKQVNPVSYHISSPDEIDPAWMKGAKSVGISGATSTPRWLMQKVAAVIR